MQSWQRSSLPRNKNNSSKCPNEAGQWVAPVVKVDDLKAMDVDQADQKVIAPKDKDAARNDLKVTDQKVGDVGQADLNLKDVDQGDHSLTAIVSAIAAMSGLVLLFYLKLSRTRRLAISVLGTIIVLFAIRIAMG